MLLHETPADYIIFCRQAIKDQQQFIEAVTKRKKHHLQESPLPDHSTCHLCEMLHDCLASQYGILSNFQERYNRAKKGIYE